MGKKRNNRSTTSNSEASREVKNESSQEMNDDEKRELVVKSFNTLLEMEDCTAHLSNLNQNVYDTFELYVEKTLINRMIRKNPIYLNNVKNIKNYIK